MPCLLRRFVTHRVCKPISIFFNIYGLPLHLNNLRTQPTLVSNHRFLHVYAGFHPPENSDCTILSRYGEIQYPRNHLKKYTVAKRVTRCFLPTALGCLQHVYSPYSPKTERNESEIKLNERALSDKLKATRGAHLFNIRFAQLGIPTI